MKNSFYSGRESRKALEWCEARGCLVEEIEGTGEVRVSHPLVEKPIKLTKPIRRPGEPRELRAFRRRVERSSRRQKT